jgi:hypothetical protein
MSNRDTGAALNKRKLNIVHKAASAYLLGSPKRRFSRLDGRVSLFPRNTSPLALSSNFSAIRDFHPPVDIND